MCELTLSLVCTRKGQAHAFLIEVLPEPPRMQMPAKPFETIIAEIDDTDVRALINDYRDVFCDELPRSATPADRPAKLSVIVPPGYVPYHRKCYPMSAEDEALMEEEIARLLRAGRIHRSTSPHGAPALIARSGGKRRMCIDYSHLNNSAQLHQFPIPSADSIFRRMYKADRITVLDAVSSFHQNPVEESSIPYLAFNDHRQRRWEWLVAPFGFVNSGSIHSINMQYYFGDTPRSGTYVDDLATWSVRSKPDHMESLRYILETARREQMYFKGSC